MGPHTGISCDPCALKPGPKRIVLSTYSNGNLPPRRFVRVVRSGTRVLSVGVAGTAVQFEYGLPRGHIARRKLRFVVTPILLSRCSESKQQETERNKATGGHGLLHDETYGRLRAKPSVTQRTEA